MKRVTTLLGVLLLVGSAAPAHAKEKVYLDLSLDDLDKAELFDNYFKKADLPAARLRMEQQLVGLFAPRLPAWEFVAGKELYPRLSIAFTPETDANGRKGLQVKVRLEVTKDTSMLLGPALLPPLCAPHELDSLIQQEDIGFFLDRLYEHFRERRFEMIDWRKTFAEKVCVARSCTFREPGWALIPLARQAFSVYSGAEFRIHCKTKNPPPVILRAWGRSEWAPPPQGDSLIVNLLSWRRADQEEKDMKPFLSEHLQVLAPSNVVSVLVYLPNLDPDAIGPETDININIP